jgi:signal peptidase I
MRPTIIEGDRIFVNKLAYGLKIPFTTIHLARWNTPQRGEIVVFFSPEDGVRMVKRVVGVPGDVIWMVDNHLFINGEPLSYTADHGRVMEQLGRSRHEVQGLPQVNAMRDFGPFKVPQGQYFMMGDNRDNSRDSRYYGTIPADLIVGRSSRVILSLDYDDYYLPRMGRFFKDLQDAP